MSHLEFNLFIDEADGITIKFQVLKQSAAMYKYVNDFYPRNGHMYVCSQGRPQLLDNMVYLRGRGKMKDLDVVSYRAAGHDDAIRYKEKVLLSLIDAVKYVELMCAAEGYVEEEEDDDEL